MYRSRDNARGEDKRSGSRDFESRHEGQDETSPDYNSRQQYSGRGERYRDNEPRSYHTIHYSDRNIDSQRSSNSRRHRRRGYESDSETDDALSTYSRETEVLRPLSHRPHPHGNTRSRRQEDPDDATLSLSRETDFRRTLPHRPSDDFVRASPQSLAPERSEPRGDRSRHIYGENELDRPKG